MTLEYPIAKIYKHHIKVDTVEQNGKTWIYLSSRQNENEPYQYIFDTTEKVYDILDLRNFKYIERKMLFQRFRTALLMRMKEVRDVTIPLCDFFVQYKMEHPLFELEFDDLIDFVFNEQSFKNYLMGC